MFLAMHQWRPLLGEGIITGQPAALLRPAGSVLCAAGCGAKEMRGPSGGSKFSHTIAHSSRLGMPLKRFVRYMSPQQDGHHRWWVQIF